MRSILAGVAGWGVGLGLAYGLTIAWPSVPWVAAALVGAVLGNVGFHLGCWTVDRRDF